MRRLKLQMQVTIDGYIAGPNGEMDWMVWNWDEKLNHYVEDLTDSVDCIVLGRKLAEGFIPHWKNAASNPENPEFAAGKIFTNMHKVVFTKTLEKSIWDQTVLAKGELVDEINKLKNQEGRDIIAYGGASFVSALIKENLIDEFHLFTNPTAIGNGKSIFKEIDHRLNLTLVKSTAFDCGIVVLTYTLNK